MRNERFKREREIVDDLIAQKGWLAILKETTPLTRAVDNYVDSKPKIGRPVACDKAPCHSSKSERKFFLSEDANSKGRGFCWVCGQSMDPYEIIYSFNGGDFRDAYEIVKENVGYHDLYPDGVPGSYRGNYQRPSNPKPAVQYDQPSEPSAKELARHKKQRLSMKKLWDEALSLSDPRARLALEYFMGRGVLSMPSVDASVKFQPSVKYYQKIDDPNEVANPTDEFLQERELIITACEQSPYFQKFHKKNGVIIGADMGNHPAILQMLRGSNFEPRRVSKLYLNADGMKLDLPRLPDGLMGFPVKKLCYAQGEDESISGAAVYLDQPTDYLMVAEGFETVAVTRSYVRIPSASTFNSSGLGSFQVPDGVKVVFVLVDHDRSRAGDKAVYKLMQRYRGSGVCVVPVFIMKDIPEGETGIDWADVMNSPDGQSYIPEWLFQYDAGYDWEELSDYYFDLLAEDAESNWQ